jgi:anthranilate synthase component 1
LFQQLAHQGSTLFLESMDGDGRNNTQSLLFLGVALVVEARGRDVFITPQTDNGQRAVEAIAPVLGGLAEVQTTAEGLRARFAARPQGGTDRDRLTAASTADALRLICQGWGRQGATQVPLHLPGVFSYDFVEQFEDLPPAQADVLQFPDFLFFLPEEVVVVNHEDHRAMLVAHRYSAVAQLGRRVESEERLDRLAREIAQVEQDQRETAAAPLARDVPLDFQVDLSDEQFATLVEDLKGHIVAGDVFQIVPSRSFRTPCPDPFAAYQVLRKLNPSPYLFFLHHGSFDLFGSSPEVCVKVNGTPPEVQVCPIAGTRPRGLHRDGSVDQDIDNRLEAELKLDEKELAEHMMLVDLARNDVARISRPGSRCVRRLLEVERYSHVMHLSSTVSGELRGELDALHAYVASANMGTLVGAPKIEAACILRRREVDRRGPYGGAVGYFCSDGSLDTAIVIRAALVHDGVATIRAGAGVVYDSDPMAEAHETRAKAGAVLRAIQLAKAQTAGGGTP